VVWIKFFFIIIRNKMVVFLNIPDMKLFKVCGGRKFKMATMSGQRLTLDIF
jgi:hypothetical protein